MATSQEKDPAAAIRVLHSRAAAGPEIEALAAALKSVSPDVSVREGEPGVYGAWEWLLPAAVMVYVGKGLLDGFLKEIGTGAAKSLKTALANAFHKGKSIGSKWATVEEMNGYIKKTEGAAESGQEPETIARPGKPQVPLRISVDLPNGVEARFVLPVELDEEQLRQALEELRDALPFALARDRRRSELLTVQLDDPDEAMRLASSESCGSAIMYREATYVYDPCKFNWIDADQALRNELDQKFEAREKQRAKKTQSTPKARGQERKKK